MLVAVLLLAFTQTLVFASADYVKNETEASTKTMIRCLQIPWTDGLDWITRSSKSLAVEKAREFIRAFESGENWALQKLDELQNQFENSDRDVGGIGMYDECIGANATYKHIDTLDDPRIKVSHNESVDDQLGLKATRAPIARVRSENLSTKEIYTIIFLSIVGAFMFTCTIFDFVGRNKQGNSSRTVTTLAKFSLYTNALGLLSTKVTPDSFPAVHGIRCLCFLSVIIAHRSFLTAGLLKHKINLMDIIKWKSSWAGVYIWITGRVIDTFLLVTGFLVTYQFLKSAKSGSRINFFKMYLHRYLRLTPCLAVTMLFVVVFSHHTGSSPMWESIITNVVDPCRESWWVNLLYIQNFVKKETLCLPQSWYLAVDMQLFWLSPIFLYPLHRWPTFGLRLLSLGFVASVVTPAYILAANSYWHAAVRLDVDVSTQMDNYYYHYSPTYTRACPYLLGMLLGYDTVKNERCLSKVNVTINWVVTCIVLLFCTWFTYSTNNSNFAYDLYTETILAVVLRPAWSIAMAWIIYACTQGYGGVVSRLFSLPIFLPLSRLSYCVYLIHLGIQTGLIILAETPATLYGVESLKWILADLVLSIAAAFVLILFFESPVRVLEKILKNRQCRSETAIPMLEPQGTEMVKIQT